VRTSICISAMALCAAAVWAAEPVFDIKPGLWDFATTVQMSGMPPIPNLDQMTPEQRARIEAAMKNMAQTHTTKNCVTREGIDKAIAEAGSNKNNTCSPKLVSATASKVVVHLECAQEKGNVKSSGDMTFDRRDSEHFTGTGTMKSTGANGRAMDVKWSMTGTYVSADCGNVKPAGK
jgi:hypothetical protein